VTVTGCVQSGDPAGTYVLIDTRTETTTAASGQGGTTEASGTSGSATEGSGANSIGSDRARSGPTQTYRLIDDGNVDFGKHLRKEVRVNGRVASLSDSSAPAGTTGGERAPEAMPPSGTTGGTTSPGSPQAGGNTAAPKFLRVTSLTKVADACVGGSAR
jgi:hypothetical protein